MKDRFGRNIDYLRISLTDRCNLRCVYCMPEAGVETREHDEILSFEEIVRVVEVAARCGIKHLRFTGGEPLVRKGAQDLIGACKNVQGIEDVAITTNGVRQVPVPSGKDNLLSGVLPSLNLLFQGLRRICFRVSYNL